jgi:hypothetical protein
MKLELSKTSVDRIHSTIDQLFNKAKGRFLGPQVLDKRVYGLDFLEALSIPGIFKAASLSEYAIPDEDILRVLAIGIASYIDSYREKAKAQVVDNIRTFLTEAAIKGIKTDAETVLGGQLADVWGKITSDVVRMVDTEANKVKNVGVLDGIIKVNKAHGIEEPVVAFLGPIDNFLCEECKRVYLMPDGRTPRLWYLSEVTHSYHKKGEDLPSLNGCHPNCRHTVVGVLPGFGFDAAGHVTYVEPGFNALKEQRKTQ